VSPSRIKAGSSTFPTGPLPSTCVASLAHSALERGAALAAPQYAIKADASIVDLITFSSRAALTAKSALMSRI
jgi:hypothetical protein